jgi:hypothetical protein
MPSVVKTQFTHPFPERAKPPQCLVALDYRAVNGRIEVKEMRLVMVGKRTLTTSLLRQLPIGKWITEDRRKIGSSARWLLAIDGWTAAEQQLMEQLGAARRSGRRRPPLSDDTLVAVSEVYRKAHATGASPTKAVQRHFHVSRSTAGRWVGRARQQGYLGPTRERQAGELRAKKNRKGTK